MPGLNLSKAEALERSAHLTVHGYEVFLDVTGDKETFIARTRVTFSCNQTGYDTFIDTMAERVISASLNGAPVDTSNFDGQSIFLNNLQAENTLEVEVESLYSKTGEGLQKTIDPVDNESYIYSQGETAHIRKMYPCFDQPNLKATFTLSVLAPQHWEVISNNPVKEVRQDGDAKYWEFTTTPPISTYITAVVAGPYAHFHDEYVGERKVPLGMYCRKSLAEFVDASEIFEVTKQGFAYFEKIFGLAYPFEKYDQVAVTDFNFGAMENAGVVTFREEILVFRSRVTDRSRERRAHVILHEMAHMWFGNMVTMYWWDDLWLNESFAEWTSFLALVEGTRFKNGWVSFIGDGKSWAYKQDQLVTTHPIAVEMTDIEAVNANFDGISYAKGSSALHQLSAYVGRDNFIKGLRSYFEKYAWKNTQLSDLLDELKATSGRDLDSWSATWLKTAGINTLHPVLEESDGRYAKVIIRQSAPAVPAGSSEVRPHRLAVALYDVISGQLVARKRTEIDVIGEFTEIPEFANERVANLFLINDGDLAYTKIRFDQRSINTLTTHFANITDPIARVMTLLAVWDMWRDAEVSNDDFLRLVLEGIKRESLITLMTSMGLDIVNCVEVFSKDESRDSLRAQVASEIEPLLRNATPESDMQLQFARFYSMLAVTPDQMSFVQEMFEGKLTGLIVDKELRWFFATILIERGYLNKSDIDELLAADDTITGKLSHKEATAAIPNAASKAEAWQALTKGELSTSERMAIGRGFMRPRHAELLASFVDPYFDGLLEMWDNTSYEEASSKVETLFPRYAINPETIEKADAWLNGLGKNAPEVLRRLVSEGRDDLARALRIKSR